MDGVKIEGTLTNQEAHDLLAITQAEYPNKHMLVMLQERHDYPVMNQWFRADKIMVQSGKQIEEEVLINPDGTAEFVRPYAGSTGAVRQAMAVVRAPWRYARSRYDIDRAEISMNRTPARMINLVKVRRAPAELAMAELMEIYGFKAPTGPTDDLVPYGLPYYIVPITTAQVAAHAAAVSGGTEVAADTGQHQGMNPSGFTDCMGINTELDQYRLWRNYNDVWSNADCVITEDDVDKMIRMHRHLGFRVPMNATDWQSEEYTNYRAGCSENRLRALDRKARENNDSLQADLGKYSGQVVIKGTTAQWWEELDSVASDPLIMVNHDNFCPVVMAGEFFREDAFPPEKSQPTVHSTMTFIQFNFWCKNRRTAGGRIDHIA